MSVKDELKNIISNSIRNFKQEHLFDNIKINIEIPTNKEIGNYSTDIARTLANILRQSPLEIAELIKKNIDKNEIIKEIKIDSSGLINLYLKEEYLLSYINKIIEEKRSYGRNSIGNHKKINIGLINPNIIKPLTIECGRSITYLDNLARIMNFCGYDVEREYYVNDANNETDSLGMAIKEQYKELCGIECNIQENNNDNIEIAKRIYFLYQDSKLEEDINFFKQEGIDITLNQIKEDLDKYRINFNIYTREQSLYDKCLIEDTLSKLQYKDACYLKDNELWLKTAIYGDETDQLLVKEDGTYTNLVSDIAYHIDKINRGYDRVIDILETNDNRYINRIKIALNILEKNNNNLDTKLFKPVRLIKNQEELQSNKEKGEDIVLTDIINEIGVNATRYYFSAYNLDTKIDLDMDLALRNSKENQIYNIEDANTKIYSILKKYKQKIEKKEKYTNLNNNNAYTILNKLSEYEDVVISACQNEEPSLIVKYVNELITLFHIYEEKEQIVADEIEEATKEKINLLYAIQIVINNALDLIGIIPEE